jgi:hypothetical protein
MVTTRPSTTTLSSSVGTTAPEPFLVRYIRAHVRKGEAARERAAQNHKKSEDHFIAAGQYLTMLEVTYAPTWQHWEALLKIKVKISTGRASELMQLASGKKDLQQIRDGKARNMARLRARNSSPQAQCGEEDFADELFDREEPEIGATARYEARSLALGPSESKNDPDLPHDLRTHAGLIIDNLIDADTRKMVIKMVLEGERQNSFDNFRNAVAELYQALSRAGR